MPMYFLLSGFCLTLGYGKNKYSKISGCCSSLHSTQISGSTIFDSTTFYFKRLTRILPVYYLCFLYALPLSFFVWYFASENSEIRNEIISGSISSLFLVQSWLIEFGQGLNGAAWTVSTLFFFYLVYPRLLVFAQNRSNHALAILMATSFFLQIVLGFSIACLAHYLSGKTYWWSTSHPLSRLPVFFMGICAGVLCVRIQNGDLDALNRKN